MAFHDPHFGADLLGDPGLAHLAKWRAFDGRLAHALGNKKIGNRLDPQRQSPRRLVVDDDPWKQAARVFPDRRRSLFQTHEPRPFEQRARLLLPGQAEVVGPVDQSRARFVQQSSCKPPRVGTLPAKLGKKSLNELGRLGLRLPREFFHGLAHRVAVFSLAGDE